MVFRSVLTLGPVLKLGMVLALVLLPSLAQSLNTAGDKHPHPAVRSLDHRGVTLPCDAARATIALTAFTAVTYADTTSGTGVADTYACAAWDESGPEHIYLLEVAEALVVDIWLGDNVIDHDLVLLNDCDSDSCLVQANTQISAELPPGSYVLVVDGYAGAEGAYTLNLDPRTVGLPDAICEDGTTTDLGNVTESSARGPITTSLFEQPNYVSVNDCNDGLSAARGGERWYKLELAEADTSEPGVVELDITATPDPAAADLDPVIWLYDGCDPDAVCLGFIDSSAGGELETVTFVHDGDFPFTLYFAVDALRPADTEAGGTVELSITMPTPRLPDVICTEGIEEDLGPVQSASFTQPSISLFGQPNLLAVFGCNNGLSPALGGERWYTVEMAAADHTYDDGTDFSADRLTLTATPTGGLDLAIWLLDGCGPGATCLGYMNDGEAGVAETMIYTHDGPEPLTLYFAVDCLTPADAEATGNVDLTLDAEVPVEKRSLGDIRSLFR